ncbi:MAG: ABC transporter ATP-binding protein [Thermoleophilaceae bacterium]
MATATNATAPSDRSDSGREVLAASGLRVEYNGIKALDGVDLQLARGEILGLIGPNGSGKTTCINALTGFTHLDSGAVALRGTEIVDWSPERRARAGLGRTFQGVRLFGDLTVEENVEVAALGMGLSRRRAMREARRVLANMGLDHLGGLLGSALPAGDERRVGIARAVAARPRFLLLDEPAAGLNDQESAELVTMIRELRDEYAYGVVLVEHDMRVIMRTCDRLQVLDAGTTISEGDPQAVSSDAAVITAYFGEDRGGMEDGDA